MNKRYRLKKNGDIAHVVAKRKVFYSPCYSVYYLYNGEKPLFAVSASKKYGNAVERNYAKRVIREIIRPLIDLTMDYSVVVVVRQAFKEKEHLEREKELCQIITKIKKEGLK